MSFDLFVLARSPLLILLAITSPVSLAWGPAGHRIVAGIARNHLSSAARSRVRVLLGNDDLAAISVWADDIKSDRPETFGWHFVDIPMNSSGFSESRDCYQPNERRPQTMQDHHNCVVDRILLFKQVLAKQSTTQQAQIEALKFLVHFVADIHQPMHAIAEARGGNDIHITEFGPSQCGTRPCNLHFAWDMGLIEHSHRSERQYAYDLESLITRRNLSSAAHSSPQDWANESFQLAKRVWINDGGSVDETYYKASIGILDKQLALAGLRLAAMLTDTLGP
jgi:S1/P1 Nuclease